MNDLDLESTLVLDALREAFDAVTMPTPIEGIVAAGRARRRRRRLSEAAGVVAITGLSAAALVTLNQPTSTRPPRSAQAALPVNTATAAYIVETQPNGTVTVTWTKQAYFRDPSGLQDALRNAGFPVLIKVGEFCKGPNDDGHLDPSGQGSGVDQVMQASQQSDSDVVFTFIPSAMPAGAELFIGYLSPSQLAVTHGRPGSVERIVPTTAPLSCTTEPPPPNSQPAAATPSPSAQAPQAD